MTAQDPFLDGMLQEMLDRTTFFPVPPRDFKPMGAPRQALDFYHLPALPDENDPLLRRRRDFWVRMYSDPLHFEPTRFLLPVRGQRLRSKALRYISTPARFETSRNWSGAYISPRDGRMLVEVYGEWTVPRVDFPNTVLAPVAQRRSSTWIGLDGQRRYFDSSLPQIGTEQFIENVGGVDVRTRGCFFQWWLREEQPPKLPVPLLVNINDYDHMMASIRVIDSTHIECHLKNQSTGAYHSAWGVLSPSGVPPTGMASINVRISGATAEWVMERPTVWNSEVLWELPDYTTVTFINAGAVSGIAPSVNERDETLVGARLIDMQRVSQNPVRMTTISEATWLTETSIETTHFPEA